jgi:hypothetical protein
MKNVTHTANTSESAIINAVFGAARANEKRETKAVNGVTVEFVEMLEGHLALVKVGNSIIGTALVDEFDNQAERQKARRNSSLSAAKDECSAILAALDIR